jgi:hypothetical protein
MKLRTLTLLLILILTFSGCVVIKEMLPQTPTPSVSPFDLNQISTEKFLPDEKIGMEIFYVKGFDEPHTPPDVKASKNLEDFLNETQGIVDLNRSSVVRFFNKGVKSERILVIVPGIYSGAGTIANLAKAIVRRNSGTEAWVWERRANQLEDRRLTIEALKEKSTDTLIKTINPKNYKIIKGSFYQPTKEEISFVGYWGLNVQLNDLKNIILEARKRSKEVYISGYSLGVIYTTLFLANNFGTKEKPEAGFSLVDRAILFDGPPVLEGYAKNENVYQNGLYIIPVNFVDGVKNLESGKVYPCNGSADRDMSIFFKFDLQATLATLDPEGLYPEPYGISKLKITNIANYFLTQDDNYQFFKLFSATLGRADAKYFGNISYKDTALITGLPDGKDKIDWISRKEGDKVEFNNPDDYLWTSNNEYFDIPEWYQPTRTLLEIGSVSFNDTSSGWQSKYFKFTENKNINIPILCIGLSRGLSSRIDIYHNYEKLISSKDFSIIMINSLTHVDGNSLTDNKTRQFLADVATNWIYGNKLISKEKNNVAYYNRNIKK